MSPFTPLRIRQRQRRKQIAGLLLLAVSPLILFNLTLDVGATTTVTWDASNFSNGTHSGTTALTSVSLDPFVTHRDDAAGDFRQGSLRSDRFEQTAVTADGEISINKAYEYPGNSSYVLGNLVRQVQLFGDYLYVSSGSSVSDGGLTVINTQGTFSDPGDDSIVATYTTTSTPPLDRNIVNSVRVEGDDLYIHIGQSMIIVDTKGTDDQSDDEITSDWRPPGTDNALLNGVWVWDSESIGDVLAVGLSVGLRLIDTNGTATTSDDVLGGQYDDGTTIALADDSVRGVHAIGNVLYLETFAGLYVIDTNGTATTSDDIFGGVHSESTTGFINSNFVSDAFVEGNLIYVAADGVSVIDTQGTATVADDVLVADYSNEADFAELYQGSISKVGDSLYIDGNTIQSIDTNGTPELSDDVRTDRISLTTVPSIDTFYSLYLAASPEVLAGRSLYDVYVYSLSDEYLREGMYTSDALPTDEVGTTTISATTDVSAGEDVTLRYRTNSVDDAVYFNDFEDGNPSEFLGDFYGYGGTYGTVSESDSSLIVSDPNPYFSGDGFDYDVFIIDTGFPDDHFPAGSKVSVRLRVNSDTRETDAFDTYVFVDDYFDGREVDSTANNEWKVVTFEVVSEPFSKIGIETPSVTGTWSPGDSLEVDWIKIIAPESTGWWNSWETCSVLENCLFSDVGTSTWLQYRLDLSTTDQHSSPLVSAVELRSDYPTVGVYTSEEYVFEEDTILGVFDAVVATSASSSIDFEYSIDGGGSWSAVAIGDDLSGNGVDVRSFTWRATLNTTDTSISPTISEVTLETSPRTIRTSTSVRDRVEQMERSGLHNEFIKTLRRDHPGVFDGSAPTSEVIEVRIKLMRETVFRMRQLQQLNETGADSIEALEGEV